jgi:hypothetical protein
LEQARVYKQISVSPIDLRTKSITSAFATVLGEAAAVCLENNAHKTGVLMSVDGISQHTFTVTWDQLESSHKTTYADLQDATELGAYGVALLVIREVTGLTAIERSAKGGGFDWWVGHADGPSLPFQGKRRVEVSGILKDGGGTMEARLKQKIRQTDPSDSLGPAIIAIIEFGQPKARVEEK